MPDASEPGPFTPPAAWLCGGEETVAEARGLVGSPASSIQPPNKDVPKDDDGVAEASLWL